MSTVKLIAIDRTRTPKDIKALSTKRVGSVFVKSGDILRGLDMEEEKVYLPPLIGISPNDVNFAKACKMFWADFGINISPDESMDDDELSVELSIGGVTDESGTFRPHNVMDWLKYRFAQKHPRVAFSNEELNGKENSKYGFFIENKEDIKVKETELLETRMQADRLFLKLFSKTSTGVDESKIDWVIDLYKNDISKKEKPVKGEKNVYELVDVQDKELFLYQKKNSDPAKFIKFVGDDLLEEKSFVSQCLEKGLLSRIGNTIVNDQQPIGESLTEAAMYLRSEKNSKVKLTLQELLRQYSVNKI